MSEPQTNTRGTGPYVNRINVGGDGPPDQPLMFYSAGVIVLGAAAIYFCLHAKETLFLLAMSLILLLALAIFWRAWRNRPWAGSVAPTDDQGVVPSGDDRSRST